MTQILNPTIRTSYLRRTITLHHQLSEEREQNAERPGMLRDGFHSS